MTESVCIYHRADLDGHCSGAIIRYALDNVEMIDMDYGEEPPWDRLKGRDVYLVDFSLEPWSEMIRLHEVAEKLVWIDHHKTAIKNYHNHEESSGDVFIHVLDVEHAACELTWEYFFPRRNMPMVVRLLGRYDVWDLDAIPNVLEFQYGMRSLRTDPGDPDTAQVWRDLFGETVIDLDVATNARRMRKMLTVRGQGILEYETVQNERQAKSLVFELEFEGHKWLAANIPFKNSAFFDSVADPYKTVGKLMFHYNGNHWTVSLRSNAIDVAEIAHSHGGGGHAGASGFTCDVLPFFFSSKLIEEFAAPLKPFPPKSDKPKSKKTKKS